MININTYLVRKCPGCEGQQLIACLDKLGAIDSKWLQSLEIWNFYLNNLTALRGVRNRKKLAREKTCQKYNISRAKFYRVKEKVC